MSNFTIDHDRVRTVRRIFEDQDFGNVELLDGWSGHELEELAGVPERRGIPDAPRQDAGERRGRDQLSMR